MRRTSYRVVSDAKYSMTAFAFLSLDDLTEEASAVFSSATRVFSVLQFIKLIK